MHTLLFPAPAFYYPPQSNRLVLAIAKSVKEDTVINLNMLETFLGMIMILSLLKHDGQRYRLTIKEISFSIAKPHIWFIIVSQGINTRLQKYGEKLFNLYYESSN